MINEYVLSETIGKGAFSKIKKCHKENSEAPLAVKVLFGMSFMDFIIDCQ